jgi:hypothetical protein
MSEEITRDGIIVDIPIVKSFRVLSFRIQRVAVVLNQSAIVRLLVEVENDGRKSLENKEVVIQEDEYLNWGSDDTYLIDLVKSKLPSLF